MNSTLVNINKTTKKRQEAGVLFIGMLFGHVVIQLVTTVTNSSAHTARVGQRAGEVDVLHVLPLKGHPIVNKSIAGTGIK